MEVAHPPSPRAVELGSLRAVAVLGRGAKGVVFLVREAATGRALALKAVSRAAAAAGKALREEEAYRRIWFERAVLSGLRHPLLPELRGFVSTEKIFGFVVDLCPGGNLTALRNRQTEKMFSDDTIRWVSLSLSLSLSSPPSLSASFSLCGGVPELSLSLGFTPRSWSWRWSTCTGRGSSTEISNRRTSSSRPAAIS